VLLKTSFILRTRFICESLCRKAVESGLRFAPKLATSCRQAHDCDKSSEQNYEGKLQQKTASRRCFFEHTIIISLNRLLEKRRSERRIFFFSTRTVRELFSTCILTFSGESASHDNTLELSKYALNFAGSQKSFDEKELTRVYSWRCTHTQRTTRRLQVE
jgi:hypothetical protein